jgi:fermentation-respiration switch protein FrsA (DUF1100 family)
VVRVWIAAAAAALALAAPAHASTRQDVTITSTDGTPLAATLHLPSSAAPPDGWPAIVVMHALSQNRSTGDTIATAAGFVGDEYAVLTIDARGHGASGGLITIDGPNEIADVRAVFEWLRARPDVSDSRIGAWGLSYGGGAALLSLAAGVPWAAVEVAETWSDLGTALMPQGLAKSGVIGGFISGLPPAKVDPTVVQTTNAALAGTNLGDVREWAARRSSLAALRGNRTPIFLMQGRRDFAFGLDQATRLYSVLRGPKRLWIGNHGHAPSTFPAPDTPKMLAEGKRWFDRFLRGVPNGIERRRPIVIAREGKATADTFARLPAVPPLTRDHVAGDLGEFFGTYRLRPVTVGRRGRFVRMFDDTIDRLEIYGSPEIVLTAAATGGWKRLVAVLTARTPAGREIVIGAGGVPTRTGRRDYRIRLSSQITFVPAGSALKLAVGASSLVQHPSNLLYLDLPMPAAARLRIDNSYGVAFTYLIR